jgi:ADP-ribosylglycohydrolase
MIIIRGKQPIRCAEPEEIELEKIKAGFGEQLFKKVYGCLAGVAVGDAMGMPSAGYTPNMIKERFGVIQNLLDAPAGHPFHAGLRRGHVTDDTELTMLVVRMILDDGHVTPQGMARRILKWAIDGHLLETGLLGPSTSRAIRMLMTGKDPLETGRYGTTNGAAMKISPIGIINMGKLEQLIDEVEKVCLPTHGTSVAISAASAVAGAIAEALTPEPTISTVLKTSKMCAGMGERRGRPVAYPSIRKRIELAVDLIGGVGSPSKAAEILYDYIGADISCANSVPTAFGLFVASGGDPMTTIKSAINMGGDTDTIGAIAGGIAGAYGGIEAFPCDIINQVEEENQLELGEVAKQLLGFIRK